MPEYYRSKQIAGTQYTRCNLIAITNPLGGGAAVQFQEEVVRELGGVVERVQVPMQPGRLLEVPYEPDADIALIDPATGQPSGQTIKQSVVYLALFSRYMAAAKARDDAASLEA
jgi:hypothetical protein